MKFVKKHFVPLPSGDDVVITAFTQPITIIEKDGSMKYKQYADKFQTKASIYDIKYYKKRGTKTITLDSNDIREIAKAISVIDIIDEMWSEKELQEYKKNYPYQ